MGGGGLDTETSAVVLNISLLEVNDKQRVSFHKQQRV